MKRKIITAFKICAGLFVFSLLYYSVTRLDYKITKNNITYIENKLKRPVLPTIVKDLKLTDSLAKVLFSYNTISTEKLDTFLIKNDLKISDSLREVIDNRIDNRFYLEKSLASYSLYKKNMENRFPMNLVITPIK